ncbi:MAG: hypothetical protein PHW65_03475, partial [Dehalococcoidales bacterium]|nr:hypothetical protein [Dehalococcoidales bacterium]
GLLRAINDLPVDAALIVNDRPEGTLTWQHLMFFQRAAAQLTKPLLASIPEKPTSAELQALWDIGVDGIVIEIGKGQIEGLGELRRIISNLTNNSPGRKRGKTGVLLPSMRMEAPVEAEEEEEDGDE